VVLEKVTKVYSGGVTAVREVDVKIADKEFVVLVGPSGCGKSTTLRMVAGLEEITSGTIRIGDRAVNDVPPKDRDIAMVFQNYALYPHMTVYNNMAFGLKLRKFPVAEIDGRVKEAARILGITDLLLRKPKALSGGQRQRVAVGRAIVRQPAAFLFDEPLSNLDAKLRVGMRAELKKLHQRLATTMIYVTHDQIEAMTLGDRIVIMRDGVIQQIDEPLTIYRQPANKFVAGFIGTPPMNFIRGKIEQGSGAKTFVAEGVRLSLPGWMDSSVSCLDGKACHLGIRPEDLSDKTGAGLAEGDKMDARVEVVEPLGDEMIVYLGVAGQTVLAKMRAKHLSVGAQLEIRVDKDKAHIFEAATAAAKEGTEGAEDAEGGGGAGSAGAAADPRTERNLTKNAFPGDRTDERASAGEGD
jgi:multiple sugar transport system ATP-binding protein